MPGYFRLSHSVYQTESPPAIGKPLATREEQYHRMLRLGLRAKPSQQFRICEYQNIDRSQKCRRGRSEKILVRGADCLGASDDCRLEATMSFASRIGAISMGSGRTILAPDHSRYGLQEHHEFVDPAVGHSMPYPHPGVTEHSRSLSEDLTGQNKGVTAVQDRE